MVFMQMPAKDLHTHTHLGLFLLFICSFAPRDWKLKYITFMRKISLQEIGLNCL